MKLAAPSPADAFNPWRIAGWSLAAMVLLLPALAMQFTAEVNWEAGNFVAAAALLGVSGLAIELGVCATRSPLGRALITGGVLALLLTVWAELAVGSL